MSAQGRRHGWAPADPYATAGAQASLEPRCGVCDQPSSKPVCAKCARALLVERFGDPKTLRHESARGCGGCGYYTGHTPGCPVVRRG